LPVTCRFNLLLKIRRKKTTATICFIFQNNHVDTETKLDLNKTSLNRDEIRARITPAADEEESARPACAHAGGETDAPRHDGGVASWSVGGGGGAAGSISSLRREGAVEAEAEDDDELIKRGRWAPRGVKGKETAAASSGRPEMGARRGWTAGWRRLKLACGY
jgi:hypothetical protein